MFVNHFISRKDKNLAIVSHTFSEEEINFKLHMLSNTNAKNRGNGVIQVPAFILQKLFSL
jgi:hypothetical protein